MAIKNLKASKLFRKATSAVDSAVIKIEKANKILSEEIQEFLEQNEQDERNIQSLLLAIENRKKLILENEITINENGILVEHLKEVPSK